jgi:putative nucleotidyltransferase with HDIG domain
LIEDVKKDPLFTASAKEELHSVICAPLELNSQIVGTLSLFDKSVAGQPQEAHFDKGDLKLFLILTQQTAISLENARLFEEVNDLFLSSIKSLAQTIDAKDPYTHGHSQRVTDIALAIVEQMGFNDEQKKQIMVAAILHDIGKIGIKDAVLSKPNQLTKEEKAIFDQHPHVGSKIMSHIDQLENIIPIIRHHHESYNGNGYPDKLKAKQIPLGARIIAIADTFDAMTSDRPYRKAISPEAAKEEITKLSGIQFDPEVVEAFNRAYSKGNFLPK